jgi:hypothetical protein
MPTKSRYQFGRKLSPTRYLARNRNASEQAPSTAGTRATYTAEENREPLSYQAHKRILGWKLTSLERRREMLRLLDSDGSGRGGRDSDEEGDRTNQVSALEKNIR